VHETVTVCAICRDGAGKEIVLTGDVE
jgi:hypothetical protein